MKKFYCKNSLLIFCLILTLGIGAFFLCSTDAVKALAWSEYFPGNVLIGGKLQVETPNTDGQIYFNPSAAWSVGGTYTLTNGTNLFYLRRTAADAADIVVVPTPLANRTGTGKGYKITSFEVFYLLSGAAVEDVTVIINRYALPATGVAVSAVAIASTYDADHDTAGERAATGDHTLTKSVTTPAFVGEYGYELEITVDGDNAPTGIFDYFGVQVLYTEESL